MDGRQTADVVIIGGGIIGCSIAYHLCKAGLQVIVVERGEVGAQASSAAAGLLAPLGPLSGPGPFADLLLASFALFPEVVVELEAASGIRPGYTRTGALRVVRNPKRLAHLQKRMQAWLPLGLSLVWLDGDEARRIEPLLSPEVCAAVYAPEESQINAPRLVQAFARAAENLGARIRTQTRVEHIAHRAGKITHIQTHHGETIACGHLVIAAGAWTALVVTELGSSLPVRPLAGQMLSLKHVGLRHILFGDAAYVVPREGEVLVGATKEDAGFAARVTSEGQTRLCDVAHRLVPALKTSSVQRQWAGLRPSTPDTRPILGPVMGWSNLLIASGHNSVGIMLSPLTGRMIADCILNEHVPELMRPFSPERFMTGSATSQAH